MKYKSIERQDIFRVLDRLKAEQKVKSDFLLPSEEVRVALRGEKISPVMMHDKVRTETGYMGPMRLMRKAEENLSAKLNVPIKYHDMIRDGHSDIYHYTFNRLLQRGGKKFMFRTFAPGSEFIDYEDDYADIGTDQIFAVRSILSDRYKRIENLDVMNVVLETLTEMKADVDIEKASVTENRLFVDVVHRDVHHFPEFLEGYRNPNSGRSDTGVISGFSIRNSETGDGRFQIVPRALVLACSNGMTIRKDALARTHLGSRISETGIIWSEETHHKEMDLIIAQTRDAVKTFLSPEYIGQKISDLLQYRKELEHPVGTAHHLGSALGFDEERTEYLLESLFKSNDLTTTGAFHAATWVAQGVSIEDQYEVEEAAYQLLPGIQHMDRPFKKK